MRLPSCLVAVLGLLAAGCTTSPPPTPPAPTPPAPTASAPTASAPASVAAAKPAPSARADNTPDAAQPTPCGALGCQLYDTPEQAFAAILATDPTIVAIGEAHAQKGSEEIASSSKRFREQLLPLLKGRASDIVIELIVAEGACKQAQEKVRETTREVTKNQAQSNKSEFVLLGERAKAMGIRPHVLRPTCDQYKALAAAGDDRIFHMLTAIADLSVELIDRILARNARSKADKAVLAYGGAMHNDVLPRKGREAFSFGPRLSELSNQRYVEIDLIVPEFIKDSDAWRALEWYGAFDGDAHPDKVTLFNPRPGSYVLIFARSAAR